MELKISSERKNAIASLKNDHVKLYVHVIQTDKKYDQRCRILKTDAGRFKPLPYIEEGQRTAVYISAPSGAGKSTYARQYIDDLRKLSRYKNSSVYIVTANSTPDPAFETLSNFFKIDITLPEFKYLQTDELKDCIVLFDDYTSIKDKDVKENVIHLLNELLEHSRKLNVALITINHQTQDYNRTRLIIFESNLYVLFPSFNLNSVEKFIKSYIGMSKDEIKKIKDLSGRSITIHKSSPRYLISDREIWLL